MKKLLSAKTKIAFYLDQNLMSLDELEKCQDDGRSIFTCLVFFTHSPQLLEYFNNRNGEGVGAQAQAELLRVFELKSSVIFGCQIFQAHPFTLASNLEELLDRPNFFENFVSHIVISKRPIQYFLSFDDFPAWESKFFSEVKERMQSRACTMHAMMSGKELPVVPLYQLDSDIDCGCLISLDTYVNHKAKKSLNFINLFNLITQMSNEKSLRHLHDLKYAQICLEYAKDLMKHANKAHKDFIATYVFASIRILIIAEKIFNSLQMQDKSTQCLQLIEKSKSILKKECADLDQFYYEDIKKLIVLAKSILDDKDNITADDLIGLEKRLNEAQENLNSVIAENPNAQLEVISESLQLVKFNLHFEFAMLHKKNNHLIDAFSRLKQALKSLEASTQKESNRHQGIVHHHMGLIKNLVNEKQTCNSHLLQAAEYYEKAEMKESAEKVRLTLYRIELNNSLEEHEDKEECYFKLWKSAIDYNDWGKFFFLHPIIKKHSLSLKNKIATEASQKGL